MDDLLAGVLTRAACLLAGAVPVRLISAFLARTASGWPDAGAYVRRQRTGLAAGQCRSIWR
jgi:hypothetical protein